MVPPNEQWFCRGMVQTLGGSWTLAEKRAQVGLSRRLEFNPSGHRDPEQFGEPSRLCRRARTDLNSAEPGRHRRNHDTGEAYLQELG